ncbi:hypothetical protein Tco_1429109 [Tanacetum coccineum]
MEESSTAAPRPTRGHRADYGFISTMDADIRHQRAEEVSYSIGYVWVDPTEAVEEVEPTTLEGVNARVTELATVQEQDIQDVYAVIEDTQERQTQLFQSVDGLAHSVGLSSAVHYELQAYMTHTQMQDYRIASQESLMMTLIAQNNMPPSYPLLMQWVYCCAACCKGCRCYSTDGTGYPMIAAVVEQLIEERVSAALSNHETLQNNTNGHGDGSHNS